MPNPFFEAKRAGEIYQVPYSALAEKAVEHKKTHNVSDSRDDRFRIALLLIDVQNTFCLPTGELFVAGRSGNGAVEDNQRLAAFIYNYFPKLTQIICTLDTHQSFQIFHPAFWQDEAGNHPIGGQTIITCKDLEKGKWRVNRGFAVNDGEYWRLQRHAVFYVKTLEKRGKFPLMIWPYHAMVGGVGHALVSMIEEAVFFHGIARNAPPLLETKGEDPLTENYSVFAPEVDVDSTGKPLGHRNDALLDKLLEYDAVFVAGQAKSHCVAWTIADMLSGIRAKFPAMADKFYLLEDCTSSVVIPDVIDFTEATEKTFAEFGAAGMHLVKSTDEFPSW